MLQEITITPSTLILIAIIAAWAIWAIRRLVNKGLCDCHDGCDKCGGCSKKGSAKDSNCAKCEAVDAMVARMGASLKK